MSMAQEDSNNLLMQEISCNLIGACVLVKMTNIPFQFSKASLHVFNADT